MSVVVQRHRAASSARAMLDNSASGGVLPQTQNTEVLRVGPAWSGRDIAEAFGPQGVAMAAQSDFSFIPVLRAIPSDAQPMWLLAALNSDYFINSSLQMLHAEHNHVDWFRYDGVLLLSNDVQRTLNARDPALRLEERVAQSEQGTIARSRHSGSGQEVLSAYRSSSRFPLIVSVHTDRDAIVQLWAADAGRITAVVLPILLCLVVAGLVIHRRRLACQQQLAARC
jgi:hypothetical protein